jgi:ATP-dependent exoDNAse (exonuclease V) alpha subunit
MCSGSLYVLRHAASCNVPLQGATFHSFLGIGQKPLTADDMDRRLRSMRRWKPDVYERLRETRAVFVDECSMMTPAFLFQADYILSRVRDQLSVPFGGMTIIFVGDFAQLPPVDSEANHQVKFIFETHLWHSAVHDRLFLLRSNHRQALDPLFAQVCSEIRVGKLTETGRALLQSRVLSERIDLDRLLGKRLFIATRNDTVSTMNERYLGGLDGQELTFRAQVYRQPLPREMHKEIDQQQLPMDSDIRIRVGSTVMLLVNRDVANGLVNGAMGTVVGGTVNANLQIRFHQSDLVHEIPYHSWSFRQGTEWVIYSQIPVRLAAAITAHKSQGMTVNSAVIVGAPRMQPAMFYVMMSRVRSRTGLFLTEFKDAWIHVPPAVLTFIDKVKSNVCRSIA